MNTTALEGQHYIGEMEVFSDYRETEDGMAYVLAVGRFSSTAGTQSVRIEIQLPKLDLRTRGITFEHALDKAQRLLRNLVANETARIDETGRIGSIPVKYYTWDGTRFFHNSR